MSPIPSPTPLRRRLARVLFSPAGLLFGFVVLIMILCPGARAVPVLEDVVLANFAAVADFDDGGTLPIGTSGTQNRVWAQGFTTSTAAQWNRVKAIDLGLASSPANPNVRVQLYDSGTGQPGSLLATFTIESGTVGSLGVYRFLPTSGTVTLAASTNYWVVVDDTQGGSGSSFSWAITDNSSSPTSNPNYGYTYIDSNRSNDGGATWVGGSLLGDTLTVKIVAVPEPSTVCLAAIGLVSAEVVRRSRRRRRPAAC